MITVLASSLDTISVVSSTNEKTLRFITAVEEKPLNLAHLIIKNSAFEKGSSIIIGKIIIQENSVKLEELVIEYNEIGIDGWRELSSTFSTNNYLTISRISVKHADEE